MLFYFGLNISKVEHVTSMDIYKTKISMCLTIFFIYYYNLPYKE